MKNKLFYIFISKIKIKITGNNAEKFLHKLVRSQIELLNIKKIKKDTIYIWVYKRDYPKIYRLSTIYNIEVVDASGWIKTKKTLSINKYFIFSLVIGLICLIILSNTIFSVQVIHNNKEIREFITNELKNYNIDKYHIKKSYQELTTIKQEILKKYKDKIEWLEIETVGVKYVVRVQLREHADTKETFNNRDVVAKKDATIKKIIASSGQIVKEINTYVKKGDTIISGTITLNDNIKGYTVADGEIFGEVWYNITVEYPFTYYEEKYTGKKKNSISLQFLNWNISIPKLEAYKVDKEYSIINNKLIPLKLSFLKTREIEVIDQILTEDEAIECAIKLARTQMEEKLNDKEYIVSQKNLKVNIKDSKVVLESFFAVYENITDYKEIIIEEKEEKVE